MKCFKVRAYGGDKYPIVDRIKEISQKMALDLLNILLKIC
jgi:hypothetical protein